MKFPKRVVLSTNLKKYILCVGCMQNKILIHVFTIKILSLYCKLSLKLNSVYYITLFSLNMYTFWYIRVLIASHCIYNLYSLYFFFLMGLIHLSKLRYPKDTHYTHPGCFLLYQLQGDYFLYHSVQVFRISSVSGLKE